MTFAAEAWTVTHQRVGPRRPPRSLLAAGMRLPVFRAARL